ncbi:MAG: MBL fold metallo-hydrolase [Bacteroidales bacterium]|nr:MBL fold metallo-hydrolase [Bacteroidales bacterium]
MKITFHGATQTVTGSKHLITLNNGKKILLDCGMFQGMGKETQELNSDFGFKPADVDYLILSHAHIDHTGLIPKLVKDGFKGRIFGSDATLDLTEVLLRDSAFIQQNDIKFLNKRRLTQNRPFIEPLYSIEDAENAVRLFEAVPYETAMTIDDDIELQLFENGHILGACTIFLSIKEDGKFTRIAFSGDVGRYGDPILKSPSALPQVDYMIIESTYGNRLHGKMEETSETLRNIIIETCIGKRGKLIIPAFSVGRTQELLYTLNEMELDYRLPDVRYYVDSPLSNTVTKIVKKHPECFNSSVQKILKFDKDPFDFKGLHFIEDKRESQALNGSDEPCVIISASGMAEAGRVKHHIANNISKPSTTILMVGYCEKNSLGARLKAEPDEVTIFGEPYRVRADIRKIESMSAHADYRDLCQYLSSQEPDEVKKVFIVHGEPESQEAFRDRLHKKGFMKIEIPEPHETFSLD